MVKFLATLAVGTVIALGLMGPVAATKPNPEHKVTICHAHPADSITGPWVIITVDVASVGYQQSGHQDEHDGDIIPPYEYTDVEGVVFTYEGKGDQSILENGCSLSSPSPSPTETPSPTPTDTETPSPTDTETPLPTSTTSKPTHVFGHSGGPKPQELASTGFSAGKLGAIAGILTAAGLGALYFTRRRFTS